MVVVRKEVIRSGVGMLYSGTNKRILHYASALRSSSMFWITLPVTYLHYITALRSCINSALRSCITFLQLHSCITFLHYISTLQFCITILQYISALHFCITFPYYAPGLHSWSYSFLDDGCIVRLNTNDGSILWSLSSLSATKSITAQLLNVGKLCFSTQTWKKIIDFHEWLRLKTSKISGLAYGINAYSQSVIWSMSSLPAT